MTEQGLPQKDEPVIVLWPLDDFFGLIVPAKTGVWYTNQTGGLLCSHPCIEGFFVPLEPSWHLEPSILENAGCGDDEYDFALVQKWIDANDLAMTFEPCPETTLPLLEAWVPVRVREHMPDRGHPQFSIDTLIGSLRGREVIVTYCNSD